MSVRMPGPDILIAAILAIAVLVASARMLARFLHEPWPHRQHRRMRLFALLSLQAIGAVLLYRTLFPPALPVPAGVLVVATAGADRVPARDRPGDAPLIAMPEAPALPGAIRVPDLATALRHHPGTTRLRIFGNGLVARDLDAARGLAVEFRPAPLPRGLVALWPPEDVHAGRRFQVGGRLNDLPGGQVQLLDPGRQRVAQAMPDREGRFGLAAFARSPGPSAWTLRLRDKAGAVIEDVPLPVDVAAGVPLRILFLAGAPNPELKYLRRWASDAGLVPDARIELGAGLQVGAAPTRFDAAALAGYDLLVLDQRSWQALGARRAPVLEAVRGGLGLLLELPDAASPGDRAALRRIGFIASSGRASSVPVPGSGKPLALTRGSLRIDGDQAVPMFVAADGASLAWWHAHGLGRIGIVGFDDSYRWVLAGDGARHGDLWASLFSVLARPRTSPGARIDGDARTGERVVLCALPPDASIDAPDGGSTRLHVDPATGSRACAGFWPRLAGWHLLHAGNAMQRFHVRLADEAPGLRAARTQADTRGLAAMPAGAHPGTMATQAGPRWPWFLAWLALATAGWWLERRRRPALAGTEGPASGPA